LDPAGHRPVKGQHELVLSAREFDLLNGLINPSGLITSRAELIAHVWRSRWIGDPRMLDVHIRWLRLKIENAPDNPRYIKTVRRLGYRFAG